MANPVFADLDGDFTRNPVTNDVNRLTEEAAIENAVKNLISTRRFERPFRPQLFCGIQSELFEPFSPITESAIQKKVKTVIENYEPRVEKVKVTATADPDRNGYELLIEYLPKRSLTVVSFTYFLERVL